MFSARDPDAAASDRDLDLRSVLIEVDPDGVTIGRVFEEIPEDAAGCLPVGLAIVDSACDVTSMRQLPDCCPCSNSAVDWGTSVTASMSSKRNCMRLASESQRIRDRFGPVAPARLHCPPEPELYPDAPF